MRNLPFTPISFILLFFFFSSFNATPAKSNSIVDSLLSTLPTEKDEAHIDHLLLIAKSCVSYDSASHYLNQALAIAEENKDLISLVKSSYFLGKSYNKSGKSEEAIKLFDQTIAYSKQIKNDTFQIKSYKSKGFSLNSMGKVIDAQQALLQGLTLANQIDDKAFISELNFALGELHRKQHDVAKAIEYYDNARAIHTAAKEEFDRCRIDYSKAITYKISNVDSLSRKGMKILEDILASDCFNKNKASRGLAITHTSLGSIYAYHDQFELAEKHILKGLEIKEVLDDSASMAYSYNELATLYKDQKKYKKSVKYGEYALQFTRGRHNVMVMQDILKRLSQAHEGLGNYKKSLEYLSGALELKDSINNLQNSEALAEMETKYESNQKEEQIIQQNLKIALQQNQFDRLLLIGLFLLSVIGGLSLWYYFRLQNKTLDAKKSQELEQLKSQFLANISHEFRTPLSLILGPLKKTLDPYTNTDNPKQSTLPEAISVPSSDLQLIVRNAARLQQLIGQLLDLSQLEIHQSQLNLRPLDLSLSGKNIISFFQPQAKNRQIQLSYETSEEKILGLFDEEKINVILVNLLSNAFKFTADGGQVKVSLQKEEDQIKIKVSDNGEGISPQNKNKVFQRFYQVDNSTTRAHEGSGIGLALTKELVDIHKGKIELESQLGKGSTFTIVLPYQKSNGQAQEKQKEELISRRDLLLEEDIHANALFVPTKEELLQKQLNANKILIIEDNEDMRKFLVGYLREEFEVLEAVNGTTGFQLAKEELPDLILSDVMMPGTGNDGFTLCKSIKEETLTSHIPVVLLTAKSAEKDILKGLEYSADDYITKPFEPQILKSRIHNLIVQRRKLRILFADSLQIVPKEMAISSQDELFIQNLMEIIDTNLSNENFGVNELGRAINMDRTQLYRKVKALSGETPSNFIKNIRLQKARYFLEQKAGNVSQVAQMVGYRNPDYFSQSFKKEFGETPKSVLQKS